MQDLLAFFQDNADQLLNGEIEKSCGSVILPTTIYLGKEILFVPDMEMLVNFMSNYATEMQKQGIVKTKVEMLDQDPLRDGGVKARIRWNFKDASGASVQTREATYFCRTIDGNWKIALIELDTPPSETFRSVKSKF